MRCSQCHRPMHGTTASDGACECGGLIESGSARRQYYTNAPKAYDYPGCVEVCGNALRELTRECVEQRFGVLAGQNGRVRRVEMDERQARDYQIPRYRSGLYVCYRSDDDVLDRVKP